MSTRKSSRSKGPVRYTSDTEGSDYATKKPSKSNKKDATTPKKASTKRSAPSNPTQPPKRQKKDPAALAADLHDKASAQDAKAAKTAHKQAWETWQSAHNAKGALLEDEPSRETSITQTDAAKKYGLKPAELGSLKHFEKKNSYGGVMKLFVEEEVKRLAWRKLGMLDGVEGGDEEVLARGEELWEEEFGDVVIEKAKPREKNGEKSEASGVAKEEKKQSPKQKWGAYVAANAVDKEQHLDAEPKSPVNQTECKKKYGLAPADLGLLSYFEKSGAYGKTVHMYDEGEVKKLAWKKCAVLDGVELEEGDAKLLKKGKKVFEETNGKEKE